MERHAARFDWMLGLIWCDLVSGFPIQVYDVNYENSSVCVYVYMFLLICQLRTHVYMYVCMYVGMYAVDDIHTYMYIHMLYQQLSPRRTVEASFFTVGIDAAAEDDRDGSDHSGTGDANAAADDSRGNNGGVDDSDGDLRHHLL